MHNLSPAELKALLDSPAPPLVIDVREAEELDLAPFAGARHLPMMALMSGGFQALDREAPVVLLCHHGVRSEMGGRFLERNGFANVLHLSGGIDAWSLEIDPSVARY